jgi:hypothetical protein
MVDPVRPGVVPTPDRNLEDRVRRLEQLIEEMGRRDMTNSTVGQGGTFRGFYDNGKEMFTFGQDRRDGIRKLRMNYYTTENEAVQIGPGNPKVNEVEQFRINDQSGAGLFATDGYMGYGIVEPSLQFLLCPIYGLAWVNGVEQEGAKAVAKIYHATVVSTIQVRNFAGGVTAAAARLRVTAGDGSTYTSSSATGLAANSSVTRIVRVPAKVINMQNCSISWLLTTTGGGTMDVWPRECRGEGGLFYDINPGFQ